MPILQAIVSFLLTRVDTKTGIIIILMTVVGILALNMQCIQQSNIRNIQELSKRLSREKELALEDKLQTLNAEAQRIEPPKNNNGIWTIFKRKPKNTPKDIQKLAEELNAIGEKYKKREYETPQ